MRSSPWTAAGTATGRATDQDNPETSSTNSFRIVSCTSYQSKPHPLLDQCSLGFPTLNSSFTVPVIMMFGISPTGEKACLHIHQVYPYFYIAYDEPVGPLGGDERDVKEYMNLLGQSINQAISASFTPNDKDNQRGRTDNYGRYFKPINSVMAIKLVKGIDFYGFHSGYSHFLKIYVLDPKLKTRIVMLLQEGAVMATRFRTFDNSEFMQQFMLDYNLAGMDFCNFDAVVSRKGERGTNEVWGPETGIKSTSYCEIEMDSWGSEISNRTQVKERAEHALYSGNDIDSPSGIASGGKLVPSLNAIWEDESARRTLLGLPAYEPPPLIKRDEYTPWMNEARLRTELLDRLNAALAKGGTEGSTNGPLRRDAPDDCVPTAFAAIALLHPLKRALAKEEAESMEGGHASQPSQSQILYRVSADLDLEAVRRACSQEMGSESDGEMVGILQQMMDESNAAAVEEDDDVGNAFMEGTGSPILSSMAVAAVQAPPPASPILSAQGGNTGMELIRLESRFDEDGSAFPKRKQDAGYAPLELSTANDDDVKSVQSSVLLTHTALLSSPFVNSRTPIISKRGRTVLTSEMWDEIPSSMNSKLGRSSTNEKMDEIPFSTKKLGRSEFRKSKKSRLAKTNKVRFDDEESTLSKRWDIDVPWPAYFSMQNCWSPIRITRQPSWSFFEDPPRATSPTQSDNEEVFDEPPAGQVLFRRSKSNSTIASSPLPNSSPLFRNEAPILSRNSTKDSIMLTGSSTGLKQIGNAAKSSSNTQIRRDKSFHNPLVFKFQPPPPIAQEIMGSITGYHLPRIVYQEPFYSLAKDYPAVPLNYGGRKLHVPLDGVGTLLPFTCDIPQVKGMFFWKSLQPSISNHAQDRRLFTLNSSPPSLQQAREWLKSNPSAEQLRAQALLRIQSQVERPTMKNKYGFKFSQTQDPVLVIETEKKHMVIMSLEIHASNAEGNIPDPVRDPVCAVFYCFLHEDEEKYTSNGIADGYHVGIIAVRDKFSVEKSGLQGYVLTTVEDEEELLHSVSSLVRTRDPEILAGWEIQKFSWGYLVARASTFNFDFMTSISRLIPELSKAHSSKEEDEWGYTKQSSLNTPGRIFLNVWRVLRSVDELKVTSYTLENVAFHVLHQRIPKFSYKSLSEWYDQGMLLRWRTMKYYIQRAQLTLELLTKTEWLAQTSEFARVYGILLYSVIIRGSQFKVEAVMGRIARPENFIMLSPEKKQVAFMNAPECIALNMEPESKLYTSPVVVLDFQSLYPSMMIAYNYCYSTIIGRVANVGETCTLGARNLFEISPQMIEELKDHINVAPNGVVFVKPHIRKGVLGRMVLELLETRVMIKASMKLYKSNKALTRILQAKQMGLKLLANVTYGYAAASFSGRMPCVEIADAIVQTGRSSLERGIALVNAHPLWQGKVVYADTDSLFVSLPGRSKEEAFDIGNQIALAISKSNPNPMKLQFEKVYLPCMLITKKRYVGFKYESVHEIEPVFHDKGIETVRRDGCPVVGKILEACLKLLFRTKDLSLMRAYLQRQWSRILYGRVSIQDFIIAKAVKLGTYKNLPPGAVLSLKKMEQDTRAEPEYGDRIPYVVVFSKPKGRLVDSIVSPESLVLDPSLQLNAIYYITKQIVPPLARIFNLVGADIAKWFEEMPKISRVIEYSDFQRDGLANNTIDRYFKSNRCLACDKPHDDSTDPSQLCISCRSLSHRAESLFRLCATAKESTDRYLTVLEVCRSCTGHSATLDGGTECVSIDCPTYYSRVKAQVKLMNDEKVRAAIANL